MIKLKVIRILKEKLKVKQNLMEIYKNDFCLEFTEGHKIKKEAEESFYYIKDLIDFLRKEEEYENYINSINNFHNQYLKKLQDEVLDLDKEEENIKSEINFYKARIEPVSNGLKKFTLKSNEVCEKMIKNYEEKLIKIKTFPNDVIEEHKKELEEKIPRIEEIKKDIIDMLELEEIKEKNLDKIDEFLNKEITTNIESEELRRVTSLILTYIDYTKEEIIKRLKN